MVKERSDELPEKPFNVCFMHRFKFNFRARGEIWTFCFSIWLHLHHLTRPLMFTLVWPNQTAPHRHLSRAFVSHQTVSTLGPRESNQIEKQIKRKILEPGKYIESIVCVVCSLRLISISPPPPPPRPTHSELDRVELGTSCRVYVKNENWKTCVMRCSISRKKEEEHLLNWESKPHPHHLSCAGEAAVCVWEFSWREKTTLSIILISTRKTSLSIPPHTYKQASKHSLSSHLPHRNQQQLQLLFYVVNRKFDYRAQIPCHSQLVFSLSPPLFRNSILLPSSSLLDSECVWMLNLSSLFSPSLPPPFLDSIHCLRPFISHHLATPPPLALSSAPIIITVIVWDGCWSVWKSAW